MNSKGHLLISLAKSALRLIGCYKSLEEYSVKPMAKSFLAAEVLGILEELVDKRE